MKLKIIVIMAILAVALSAGFIASSTWAACGGGCAGGSCGGAGCGCKDGCGPDSCGEAKKIIYALTNQTIADAQNIGNTVCPIEGDPIDPEHKFVVYHNGMLINLCCADCLEEFNKKPVEYTAKALASVKNNRVKTTK